MEIHLDKTSIVDQQSGEVRNPDEYVENLRELEAGITRIDGEIANLKEELSHARKERESRVARLRAAVREGKVLPLLEVAEQPETDEDDGLGIDDED